MAVKEDRPKYTCIREKQLNTHENDIIALKTRSEFKEQQIKDLNDSMHEVQQKLDEIKETLQDLKLQSAQGDSTIDNRVTALENTVKVLKWIISIAIPALSLVIVFLTFALTHFH